MSVKLSKETTYILYSDQVRLDKGDVITALEHANNTSVLYPRRQDSQEIVEK